MSIRIYNSLTKTKEEFVPLNGKIVKMYSCGVTVYDRCHLGHARSLYIFDVIRRYLKFRDYDVCFVRNITDVDDKIINRAQEQGRGSDEVAEENVAKYYEDMKSLGIRKADKEPRATENIEDMIGYITGLIEKGYAYNVDGNVYYSVRKFKDYGRLSGQSLENMQDAVRIGADSHKRDPLDFALWKKSGADEPGWDSPWGRGRPGWHIECSCMSLKHLDCETLDIHAGGRDLIFPHHENEIAQAEPLTGKPFAKYWIHHGLLTINGQKMAKSLGNFITVQDALKKYSVDQLKMFFLASHYASPVDFTEGKMEEAHKALQRFDILFWRSYELLKDKKIVPKTADFIIEYKNAFVGAMDDDFNTSRGLAVLFDFINETNRFMDQHQDDSHFEGIVHAAVSTLEDIAKNIFGLFGQETVKDLSDEEQALLEERKAARAAKNFQRSDELRDALKKKGIVVEDSKDGQTWRWA